MLRLPIEIRGLSQTVTRRKKGQLALSPSSIARLFLFLAHLTKLATEQIDSTAKERKAKALAANIKNKQYLI